MAEAHQARMQNKVEEMVQSLERDHIRKMQVGSQVVCRAAASCPSPACLTCVSAAGSHVQLQCGLLQSQLRLHVSGPSVHREVSHSSGPSSGSGHLRAGEVSGEGRPHSVLLSFTCYSRSHATAARASLQIQRRWHN